MMALDTGSDLFRVSYAPNFEVSKYDPKGSSTSKKVRCSVINVWEHSTLALIGSLIYVSDQTSTSGILVEDVLHLTTEVITNMLRHTFPLVVDRCKVVHSWILLLLMVCLVVVWRRCLFLAFYPGKALLSSIHQVHSVKYITTIHLSPSPFSLLF
ncbi:uncharacterized protein LOC133724305 [Rosa rugosa]|uniref:uncharacterized protein LOC133724305 n=1 Tax=Rosa rugosa TaxID=74645 RepID=UPI002B411EA5|nr:uncharacterized protein LOC133724305 [Rosa rugosa]